jgi:hypothetical protein
MNAIRHYDEWLYRLLENEQLEIVVSYCSVCNGEIYKGEEIYFIEEEHIHEECFEEYAKQTLDAYLEVAE